MGSSLGTEPTHGYADRLRGHHGVMLLVVLLIVLAIVTGVLGALIKGAFYLFILTVLFLIGAYLVGRANRK